MPEVETVAVITARPESADEFAGYLADMAAATHTEPGCIFYSLQRSLDDPAVFVTVERWESREALQGHMESAHVAEAMAKGAPLFANPPQIIVTTPMNAGDPAKYTYGPA